VILDSGLAGLVFATCGSISGRAPLNVFAVLKLQQWVESRKPSTFGTPSHRLGATVNSYFELHLLIHNDLQKLPSR